MHFYFKYSIKKTKWKHKNLGEIILFGPKCFWNVESVSWKLSIGGAGGFVKNVFTRRINELCGCDVLF